MKEQKAHDYAKNDWKHFSNGVTLSQKDAESSSKEAFINGWDAAMKERDEEMIRFAEWCQNKYFRFEDMWVDFNTLNVAGKTMKFTTAQLLEKFRALPPKEIT